MKEQRALQVLQALVHGIDPMSGDELPPGTILQEADVLRALLAGNPTVLDGRATVGYKNLTRVGIQTIFALTCPFGNRQSP